MNTSDGMTRQSDDSSLRILESDLSNPQSLNSYSSFLDSPSNLH